jgi:light-regulated signal transduction histidine kinase (bacteriophytochrome)
VHDEVLVTFTDYTPLKRTQHELEELVEDLRRSNANLEEFAHAASHDLKEPIRKIRVFSGSLESSLGTRLNDHERHLFARMLNATERMTLLVDDLLEYSHITTTPMQQDVVDLNVKLKLVLSDLELLIDEKSANIIVGPMPVVKGYRRQLQQLFQNLIGNALKYSKPDVAPEITIRASIAAGADMPLNLPAEYAGKQYHILEVQDNGIGFEQQYAERIFQMFQRLWGKTEYSGTGIGLSIARKVVQNHKGYIWARSKPGEGATFFIALPA